MIDPYGFDMEGEMVSFRTRKGNALKLNVIQQWIDDPLALCMLLDNRSDHFSPVVWAGGKRKTFA